MTTEEIQIGCIKVALEALALAVPIKTGKPSRTVEAQ